MSLSLDTPDLAADYEAVSADRQFEAGKALIRVLAPAPGERVLDLGCGTGQLAEHVAGLVAPGGQVLGIDPLPHRIALARLRIRPELRFEVGQAEDLAALAEAGFDLVYLNAVFHWLEDKPRVLREIHRVLRPGGRLGISTGDRSVPGLLPRIRAAVLARPEFQGVTIGTQETLRRVDGPELDQLLSEAGFTERRIESRPYRQHFASPEALIRFAEASSFGNLLGPIPALLRDAARQAIEEELAPFATADGIEQPGARLVAVAIRP